VPFVSVFNVSNPKLSQKRTISAREVLDQGAQRIESELSDAPVVKARLLEVLGDAYRYIGESSRSAELLNQATDLYLDQRVDQPLAAARVLGSLAVVYSNNDFPKSKAEQVAVESLRLREQFAEPDSLLIADALNTLGIVRQSQDRYDEAEALLTRSLDIRERLTGVDSLEVASALHNLGLVEANRGSNLDKALAYFERALELKRKHAGDHNPDFEVSQSDYGKALGKAGQRERAVEVLRRNLVLALDLYGEDSEIVASGHNEIGFVLHDMGHFSEAAREYRAAMTIREKLGGSDRASYAIPLNNLASAYEDVGDYQAAEPLYRQSLELRKLGQDADSPLIANGEYNLARLLIKRGRYEEARALAAQAIAIYRKRFGENHRNVAKVALLDAERLLDTHQFDAARIAFDQILASPVELNDAMLARRYALASRFAEQRGDFKAALSESELALAAERNAWGDHHPLTLEYALTNARLIKRNGDQTKANALIASVADLAESFSKEAPVRAELSRLQQ
jgi:eukaryotic-like serine/threonine-protein kinase